jgi:hypothetical protein
MRPQRCEPDAEEPAHEPAYQPSPQERSALETYLQSSADAAPRMKVRDGEATAIAPDHPEPAVGEVLLMAALGTTDRDFFGGIVRQLGEASSHGGEVDERALNFMLSVVKGIKPRDQVEAMLATQMAAIHIATLTSAQRLAQAETLPAQDSAERAFNKLSRTYATQMEALERYRSGGDQNVTVQHVSVRDGGQAIVGNVTQAAHATVPRATSPRAAVPRATLPERPAISPPAPADIPITLLSQPELAREMVRRARKDGARSPA